MTVRRPVPSSALAVLVGLVCACSRAPKMQVVERGVTPLLAASTRPPEPPPGPPVHLFASRFYAKIRIAPAKDAERSGYMRGGTVVLATTERPLGFEDCRKGWYELASGGFVCATADVIPFDGDRLPGYRPVAPDVEARLPFLYGLTRNKGTPMFRRVPTDAEWTTYQLRPPPPSAAENGVETNAGEPPPTLASLIGDPHSALVRRLERGFYVSLDREVEQDTRSYWQTQSGGYVEKKQLQLVEGSSFQGTTLDTTSISLPVAFVISASAKRYSLDAKGRLHSPRAVAYHQLFSVSAETELNGKSYLVAADGGYYLNRGLTVAAQRAKPREVADDEKWIDVDLGSQTLVAYVGAVPVYATAISSGRIRDEYDPHKNFQTPIGSFRITGKHVASTMDGDIVQDGPYSIEDVPYVMYFSLAYALHAAFWHDSFGRPHSHGCVNLSPLDAKWLFFWTLPQLPTNWHGVYATSQTEGTRIYVHGTTPLG